MTTMQKVYLDAQAACGIKPGDWVLVRNNYRETWLPDIFLHLAPTTQDYYCCTRGPYLYCIPYEGNEHLALTTKTPSDLI